MSDWTILVQLAPCCLEAMWNAAGRYSRPALARHLAEHHRGRGTA